MLQHNSMIQGKKGALKKYGFSQYVPQIWIDREAFRVLEFELSWTRWTLSLIPSLAEHVRSFVIFSPFLDWRQQKKNFYLRVPLFWAKNPVAQGNRKFQLVRK